VSLYTRLKRLAREKHSSLLGPFEVTKGTKIMFPGFYNIGPCSLSVAQTGRLRTFLINVAIPTSLKDLISKTSCCCFCSISCCLIRLQVNKTFCDRSLSCTIVSVFSTVCHFRPSLMLASKTFTGLHSKGGQQPFLQMLD
jgi:hypothetical protein